MEAAKLSSGSQAGVAHKYQRNNSHDGDAGGNQENIAESGSEPGGKNREQSPANRYSGPEAPKTDAAAKKDAKSEEHHNGQRPESQLQWKRVGDPIDGNGPDKTHAGAKEEGEERRREHNREP